MANSNINIMGVLNSVTTDQTIARAEQIELTQADGTKIKVSNAIAETAKGASSQEIEDFKNSAELKKNVTEDKIFICTKATHANYSLGHIYFFDHNTLTVKDITPSTGGGGGGGTSSVDLTVHFRESSILANTDFSISYTWTSKNVGYGSAFLLIDGILIEDVRQTPGTYTFNVKGLQRGTHSLSIYTTDSNNEVSNKWDYSLIVGSLELLSDFNDSNMFKSTDEINIPFTYYATSEEAKIELVYSVFKEIDSEHDQEIENKIIPIKKEFNSLNLGILTPGFYRITMKLKSTLGDSIEYSNTLKYFILSAQPGVLYASALTPTTIEAEQNNNITSNIRLMYIGAKKFSVDFYITKKDNNTGIYNEYKKEKINSVSWTNGVNSFIASLSEVGEYRINAHIVYNGGKDENGLDIKAEASILYKITIIPTTALHLEEITKGLILHLHVDKNRNNEETDGIDQWIDTSPYDTGDISRQPVPVHLNDFNFTKNSANGWKYSKFVPNRKCLVITAGAYAEIDLAPLLKDVSLKNDGGFDGFTFDIEFATEDILDEQARVVSCFRGDLSAKTKTGFYISTDTALLHHSNNTTSIYDGGLVEEDDELVENKDQSGATGIFTVDFPQREINRITFVISRGEKDTNDEKKIHYGDYASPMMSIYVNGVITAVQQLKDIDSFENGGQKIMLGCDNSAEHAHKGYCEIFNIRAYNRALSLKEVLQNQINDIEDDAKRTEAITRNRFVQNSQVIDMPSLYLIMPKIDQDQMSKKIKRWGKIRYIHPNADKCILDNVVARFQWQGTSSLQYDVKNYKMKLYNGNLPDKKPGTDENKLDENGRYKYSKKWKYNLGNGIKENTFCLKADYMDSAHMRNTGNANFVNDFGTETCPPQDYFHNSLVAIYGYPILFYMVEPKNPEQQICDWEADNSTLRLIGVFNFNLDKSCTKSLSLYNEKDMLEGIFNKYEKDDKIPTENQDQYDAEINDFNTNYPNWDCMSIEGSANSDEGAGAFKKTDDDLILSEFEMRFDDLDDSLEKDTETLVGTAVYDNAESLTIDGINPDINSEYFVDKANNILMGYHVDLKKIVKSEDPSTFLSNTVEGDYEFNYDFKLLKSFFPENDDNYKRTTEKPGIVNIKKNEAGEYIVTHVEPAELYVARYYSHIKKLIRWVIDSQADEKNDVFKKEFEAHFNLSGTVDYFNIVYTMLLVDNFGKNCMWNTWGPASMEKQREHPEKYIAMVPENRAYIRKYDNYIWRPQFYDMDSCLGLDNTGVKRFDVDCQVDKHIFNTSTSKLWAKFMDVFKDKIIKRYIEKRESTKEGESKFTMESILHYFYDKQINAISERDFNDDAKQKYLTHQKYLFMCHGRQYEFFRKWMEERLYFIDSEYEYGTDWHQSAMIRIEYKDFNTKPLVYKIKTYRPSFVSIAFTAGNTNVVKLKVPRNKEVVFSEKLAAATDQETIIYNSPNIKSIGDISEFTPKLLILGNMKRLTELIVGTEKHPNPNLTTISLEDNTYLTKLVMENCTAMNTSVDVSRCTNLEYVSTKGSAITTVATGEQGGALKKMVLSNKTQSLVLRNFPLLKEVVFDGLDALNTLEIINCPFITGYKQDGIVHEGYLVGNILNNWNIDPNNSSAKIHIPFVERENNMVCGLFGKMTKYHFLDACSNIYEKYGGSSRIVLEGKIDYMGADVPYRYSTYGSYFPKLHITYDNVNDVSGMFKDYNNINLIGKKLVNVENEITHEITKVEVFYWKDNKYDIYSKIPGALDKDNDRLIQFYDDDDQEKVADEIRDRLKPFSKFTNMSEMFANCKYLEKIHPDTFDRIDVSKAINNSMFSNCTNLKYIECPKFNKLYNFVFFECPKAVIWIPKTVKQIDQHAFLCQTFIGGMHQLLLFEDYPGSPTFTHINAYGKTFIPNGRDCRFNILRDPSIPDVSLEDIRKEGIKFGRALLTEKIECPNIIKTSISEDEDQYTYTNAKQTVEIEYFLTKYSVEEIEKDPSKENQYGKLIKEVFALDQSGNRIKKKNSIPFHTWNIAYSLSQENRQDIFKNPLNIAEMLYGSMKYFDNNTLREISVPSYNIKKCSESSIPIDKNEVTIMRLFNENFNERSIIEVSSDFSKLSKVNILTNFGYTTINSHLFEETNIKNVVCQAGLKKIGDLAFQNSLLEDISYQYIDSPVNTALQHIGLFAFYNTHIHNIYIPNTVTYIGESAYANNKYLVSIKYSLGMDKVPRNCFAKCDTNNGGKTESISGFSPTGITAFEDGAFEDSTNLQIVKTDLFSGLSKDIYNCYWVEDTDLNNGEHEPRTRFLDYFPNLNYIGSRAFKNIENIRAIKLNPKIQFIGSYAFTPPNSNRIPKTLLYWENEKSDYNYSKMRIYSGAFAGREFDWQSNIGSFKGILKQTVYIPKSVYEVKDEAFATKGNAIIRYALTDAAESDFTSPNIQKQWSDSFVSGHLKTIYNYESAMIFDNALYFLLNNKTAIYAELLNDNVTINIPVSVSDGKNTYDVVEIAEEAFLRHQKNINNIVFKSNDCKLKKIGRNLFDASSVIKIYVEDLVSSIDTENAQYIPKSVEYVGEGIPFKSTVWFKNIKNKMVYLNDICLGYAMSNISAEAIPLENQLANGTTIKNTTKIIYDDAFKNENIKSILLPTHLKRISDNAFRNCSLTNIDFSPCAETLEYIGNSAFAENEYLTEMHYTKALRHVGSAATANCPSITKYIFDEGCKLDSSSFPISPILNETTLDGRYINTTITDLKISDSMGEFFSPYGNGNLTLMSLANLKNLILGEYKTIPLILSNNPAHPGMYEINLNEIDLPGWKGEAVYYEYENLHPEDPDSKLTAKEVPIVIYTKNNKFDVPLSTYTQEIDISNVKENLYEDLDIIRIIMGYTKKADNDIHYMTVTNDFSNRASASIYMKLFKDRVSFKEKL